MESSTRNVSGIKQALPHWQSLSFFVALGMTQLFLYVNYKGEGLDRTVAMFYIMAPSLLLGYILLSQQSSKVHYQLEQLRLVPMIAFGLMGFIVAWAFTILVLGQLAGEQFGTVQITSLWGTVITQVVFVACSEELIFRYALPAYLKAAFHKAWWIIPVLLSQASFAMFHWGVYGGSTFSLLVAFIFGMVMYGAYQVKLNGVKLGLGFTIGCHAAYNLVLVGVLAGQGHIIMTVGG